jgi:citrate lyase subunit beta/citryl-CoA lyase
MEILRSWLFVPANRERMLEKAGGTRADAIVIDLEDAVVASQKATARALARRWIPKLSTARRRVFVRINPLRSGLARDDVMAVVNKKTAGIVLPKVESAQDLRDLDVLIREGELEAGVRPGDIRVIPLIESARGVLRCEDIARASDRVAALSIGAEDYANDLGIERRADGVGLQHIRGVVVQVAAAYGLLPIDTPFTDFRDIDGLVEESRMVRALGLKAKYAIHPDQVAPINKVFAPSPSDVAAAERTIEAYERAVATGAGAVSLDGQMIDAPIAERARSVIAASKRR